MADLDPLAVVADLTARRVTVASEDEPLALLHLREASAAVRDAAGYCITRTTTTHKFSVLDDEVTLPGYPVVSVDAVSVEGSALSASDWTQHDNRLHLPCQSPHWARRGSQRPPLATVTWTHGLVAVPTDIVGLVCALAAAKLAATLDPENAGGLPQNRGVKAYRIDDFSETLDGDVVVPGEIPEAQRKALRARFGGGIEIVGSW